MNLICFNRKKENLTIINDKIINNFNIYNRSFSLKAIICSPFSGHYSGIITNLENDVDLLKKGKNYLYNDLKNIII